MTINAIVFDMDDTLYDETDYVVSGFKTVDRWIKEHCQVSGFYQAASELFKSGERTLIFNKAMDKLNVVYDDNLIKSMVDQYRSHQPDIQLSCDTCWVFEHLNDSVKVGLISDGYLAAQEQKVRALKLQDKCHSIILTDRWGRRHWKPSPVPYEQASRELQLPHDQCVYIGDNVNKDFITAKRLGWTTIHIDRTDGIYSGSEAEQEYRAHYSITDLRELPELSILKHMFV